MNKKIIWIGVATAFAVATAIIVAICINEAYKVGEGYITVWNAEDALAYAGSVISFAGTIILGVIAWQQNTRLLKLEERNFLAANAASAVITEIAVTRIRRQAANFNLHEEQILFPQVFDASKYFFECGSIGLICKVEPFDNSNHIAMVNVKQMQLICSNDGDTIDACIETHNPDSKYTRVAVSKKFYQFEITLIMSKNEKEKLIEALGSSNSKILIEMTVLLLTDKYVATELKCHATLMDPDYDEEERIYSHFKTREEFPPVCFWYGVSLKRKEDVSIKSITEDKQNG